MKNTMVIDATHSCLCSLVSSINDGTARVFLNIESDLSLNPYLQIGSTKVTIAANPFLYEIARSLWVGTGTLTFRIVDDSHTGDYFSIPKISKYNDTLKLNKIDNFNYEFSIYEEPITVEELDEKVTKVESNVRTLDTNFSNYKTSSDKNFTTIENNFKTVNTNYANMDSRVGDNESSIENLIIDLGEISDDVKNIANVIYPVGSIYMSVNNVNPSTLFGGTWVAWGAGRVPVGVNSSDSDFSSVEKTGGEKTHKLTSAEMPAHAHGEMLRAYGYEGWSSYQPNNYGFLFNAMGTNADDLKYVNKDSASQQCSVVSAFCNTQQNGGDGAHNNLQPYITCYMWKRTK